ncbi:hypothetical protein NUM3379_02300 [Kineococcus sp. NUM-3379]
MVEVTLLRVPLLLRERSTQHGAELMRELALIAIGAAEGSAPSPPRRLLDLAHEVQTTLGPFLTQATGELDEALARGEEFADVTYAVPRSITPVLVHMAQVQEQAEEFCREGRYLLTLAAPEDVLAFRTWLMEEFHRQSAGEAPRPWPEAATPSGPPGTG